MRTPTLPPGTLFASDYRIARRINGGGMGDIYLAEQLSVNTPRAIKVMKPQMMNDPDWTRRFEQEAKIGSRIASEHVVQVVGAGVDAETGLPWLAMEFLDGEDLSSAITRRGVIPLPEAHEILRQLCHALAAAHSAGIVHRDLKPENIMLARSRRSDVPLTVKILDFGISKILSQTNTLGTATIGTPQWMAPEQTASESIGPAADVWALGLIMFRMLVGKFYWQQANTTSPSIVSIMREVVLEPLVPASTRARQLDRASTLPAGFDAWFSRCVVREVKDRFPDASAAFAAFETTVLKQVALPLQPLQVVHSPKNRLFVGIGSTALAVSVMFGISLRRPPAPKVALADLAVASAAESAPIQVPELSDEERRRVQSERCLGSPSEEGRPEQLKSCRQRCFNDGHAPSCLQLGELQSKVDGAESVRAYQLLCNETLNAGCSKLAALHEQGAPNLTVDKEQALKVHRPACEKHHQIDSCLRAARMLKSGNGVPTNLAESRRMYKLACSLSQGKNREACPTLPPPCRRGDLRACLSMCETGHMQSCVDGMASVCQVARDGQACFLSGMLLVAGPRLMPGLRTDIPRARQVLQRGCETGHVQSCTSLRRLNDAFGAK
jgi:serine/threonine protein kinase